MNNQQIMGLIRQVLPILATLATTVGLMSPEEVGELSAKILAVAGPVVALASIYWSMRSKTDKAILESAMLPEVQCILTKPTPKGQKLAESVQNPNVKVDR